ncbi:MAG: protein translocase subunit SecDF [Paludibacteraceae bacterium]|nr:protein translocase subunit SecDF [Paludibacteraceae bacterium]
MQNKGFVRLFSVLLLLVCLYYLSFTAVTNYHENKAKKIAGENNAIELAYLDSIAGEKVWFGYTFKQCREKELNLGLDLKGGMNVTLEVSIPDILNVLSGYNTSENFQLAIENAKQRQHNSQEDFLNLFYDEFKKIDPDAQLSTIFSTFNLKEKIQRTSTNDEVMKVLNEEVNAAIDNSFNVIRNRIDRFGVVQPNIQRLDAQGRIMVELPGIKEPERVRKLLQGSANLEFWETYELSEIIAHLSDANDVIRALNEANVQEEVAEVAVESTIDETESETETDSLASVIENNDTQTDAEKFAAYKKGNPLFAVLNIYANGGQVRPGPAVGMALASDTAKVNAYLRMKQVKDVLPRDLALKWTVKSINDESKTGIFELIAIKVTNRDGRAPLSGEVITDANADFGQFSSSANVNMQMNSEGSKTWARLTKENIGKCIAIVLDDYVYSYPRVNSEITGGRSEITGNFTTQEAKDLANVLKSGKMPAPTRIVQEDIVGPSLGQTAIKNGMISFIIAFILVLLYMICYYGLIPGLIADFALLSNMFFMFGIMASFQAVLTLPGIAGIVLTLGMAIDANVLIYERTREELAAGKNLKKAIADGYKNAYSAILDGNITTLLTGIVLFVFGTGPIRGFATTLIIGIITTLFTSIFLTRLLFERIMAKEKMPNLQFTTNITKNWFRNCNINFVKTRKIGYIISGVLMLTAIVSLATKGLEQGIDFSGGRNYVIRFEQPVNDDIDDIRENLSNVFTNSQVSVITMGTANQIRISTNYEIENTADDIDEKLESMLYNALKNQNLLSENVSKDLFVEGYVVKDGLYQTDDHSGATSFGIQSSQKVGPTVASDIKISAIWAILISLVVIGLYILIRFRNIAFSVGTIVALIHDTLFIFGIYSIFSSILPFSLEIDQTFIAAILTIIGYSVNDTVVIFDRIREDIALYPKRDKTSLFNMALNSTLGRTFSTSLSTILVVLAMFIFGGETIRGFLFAMLLGMIIGIYSTLYIATPIAFEFSRRKEAKQEKEKEK